MGRCLRLIRLSRGNGTGNGASQQCQQKTGAIHRAEPFRHNIQCERLYRKGFRVRRSRRGPRTRDAVLVVSMRIHQICTGWGYLLSRATACASGRTGAGSGRLHRRLPAKRQGGGDSHRYVLWFGGRPGQSACGRADLRDQDPAQAQELSLLIASAAQAYGLARDLDARFDLLAERFWPGPLTLIVRAGSRLPLRSTANPGDVALRVPDAAIPRAIVEKLGLPITATSANLQGLPECNYAACHNAVWGSHSIDRRWRNHRS